jgi:hypothetical protein
MGPDNAQYFHWAYAVTAVVYGVYAALLVRRRARVRRALEREGLAGPRA